MNVVRKEVSKSNELVYLAKVKSNEEIEHPNKMLLDCIKSNNSGNNNNNNDNKD